MTHTEPEEAGGEAIGGFRDDMLRFARLQLRDKTMAEDAVQEAMAAALAARGEFKGQAALKTWVFAILRHKIADAIRRGRREVRFSDLLQEGAELDATFEDLFEKNGRWTQEARPRAWADPEESLTQRQFWRVFQACLDHLPEQTARLFMMREFLDFDVEEICERTGLTANNCYVVLYRARARLRRCLEQEWFQPEER